MTTPTPFLFFLFVLACLAGCGDSSSSDRGAARVTPALPQPALGTNVRDVTHWSAEWVFVDCFKQSSPSWIPSDAKPLALRPDGYPARLAPGQTARVMLQRSKGRYPAGRYTCAFDGNGRIRISGDAVAESSEESPGEFVFEVAEPKRGFDVEIVRTDPADPIRNIRVWLPGFAAAEEPFHPLFLDRMSIYSVIRFMDMQKTNDSPTVEWSDRTRIDARTQTDPNGVAPEYAIDIANAARKHAWFCIPHRASDDYVRRFAALVRERLAPGLRCYVEYSNECWNGMFGQRAHCVERGRARKLPGDDQEQALRFYAERSVEIFRLFRDAFDGRAGLQCVLAVQASSPRTADIVLNWKGAHAEADAVAIAPYVGGELGLPDQHASVRTLSIEAILERMSGGLDAVTAAVSAHAKAARRHGLPLLAYEGGQHLFQLGGTRRDDALTKRFIATNRHPRMEAIYRAYLSRWREAGGTLLCHYLNVCHSSTWGCWGAIEWQGQPIETAPKYRALAAFSRAMRATTPVDALPAPATPTTK